ncbi:unnamed protein product [Rangifer tarandus platyrhynchus]|uniref:Uncharacterized protein n=1 Tax=Rangifer tarandus platyrhynchus TaxID=3082113 RepID=A0AC59Y7C3_RANTA
MRASVRQKAWGNVSTAAVFMVTHSGNNSQVQRQQKGKRTVMCPHSETLHGKKKGTMYGQYNHRVASRAVPSKDVSGSKWYGRRSQPEPCGAAGGAPGLPEQPVRPSARSQLCSSASLESMESLKSDEEADSAKEPQNEFSEVQASSPVTRGHKCAPSGGRDVALVPGTWRSSWKAATGVLSSAGYISTWESGGGRAGRAQVVRSQKVREEAAVLMALVPTCRSGRRVSARPPCRPSCPECSGPRLFCSMGDGRGFAFPEQIISSWAQEGVHNGREVLQVGADLAAAPAEVSGQGN